LLGRMKPASGLRTGAVVCGEMRLPWGCARRERIRGDLARLKELLET
jgi:hypothetical protein